MADPEMDEDLFADLYDGEADDPGPTVIATDPAPGGPFPPELEQPPQNADIERYDPPIPQPAPIKAEDDDNINIKTEPGQAVPEGMQGVYNGQQQVRPEPEEDYEKPIGVKEDGKMFIGGLNWETTDQSLKDYFSQFGEVVDTTVMRDGATGRSRGFGFLTFKDPKTVNVVMVKEHSLDGKLIDPKRAIPRDEQERTAKIFVGGVSQECTEMEFKQFFMDFGRVLDATLMMDKDTGRPRGFGFVTFDSEAAVDRTLEGPLSIHGKMIEVKRAQPRGNLREDEGGHGKFGRNNRGGGGGFGGGGFHGNNDNQQNQMGQNGPNGGTATMSPAMMANYWQRMQQYFQMMQQQIAANNMGGMGGMNPMAAMQNNPQMMQQMMQRQGMNPQMMQQMQAQMQQQQGGGGAFSGGSGMQSPGPGNGGSPMNGGPGEAPRYTAQEQLMFEQQKYEQQQSARMQQGSFQGGNTWEGMYDDVPAPAGMQGGGRGNFGGGRGRGGRGNTPQAPANAPANAPTGPKNAGIPGANYRGGGRGSRRGFHPYARGNGA